ncbi:MAG: helix-turn-helix domain-containing protein [Desulfotomaculales bacterium]
MQDFGRILRRIREEKGLTQEELARLLGVRRPTLAHWERGAKHPGIAMLTRLADVLEVSADRLLGRNPPAEVREGAAGEPVSASDPLVRRLARRAGVPSEVIAAFLAAVKKFQGGTREGGSGTDRRDVPGGDCD